MCEDKSCYALRRWPEIQWHILLLGLKCADHFQVVLKSSEGKEGLEII